MRGLALSLVVLLAGQPALGLAADSDAPSGQKQPAGKQPTAKQKEEAKKAYLRAIEAYKAGNYQKAAVELKRVYTMVPIPAVLFNLGVTYAKLGKREAAKEAISEYLRTAPNAPNRGDAEKLLALLSGKTTPAASAPAAPTAEDMRAARAAAAAQAAKEESEAAEKTAESSAKKAEDESAATSSASDTTTEEATETAKAVESPAANEPPPQQDAENPLLGSRNRQAREESEDTDYRGERDVDAPSYRFWKWTTAGLAVAAVGTGIFFYHQASEQESTLRRIRGGPEELPMYAYDQAVRAVEDGYQSNRLWGTVALVSGGVLAASSITLFILDLVKGREKGTRAEVTPVAGSNFAGIAARGAF